MRKSILATLLMSGLLTITAAHAQGMQQNQEKNQQRMAKNFERISSKLGLNDSQKKQWIEQAQNHRAEKMQQRAKNKELRMQLKELKQAGSKDSKKLEELAQKMGEQTRQKILLNAKHKQELSAILTPEQQAIFNKISNRQDKKRNNKKYNRQKSQTNNS